MTLRERLKLNWAVTATGCLAVAWLLAMILWRIEFAATSAAGPLIWSICWLVFSATLGVAAAWVFHSYRRRAENDRQFRIVASIAFLFVWQFAVFAADARELYALRVWFAQAGLTVVFVLGLAWTVYILETASEYYELRRRANRQEPEPASEDEGRSTRNWNPLDHAAWFYGNNSQRLNQSIFGLTHYIALFLCLMFLFNSIRGCRDIYEMPFGGGKAETVVQVVKIQKIIRKRYIVNPFSSILFNVPPIDDVVLNLAKLTKHAYQIGQGEGKGAGFAGGTKLGKVRFIRLEYSGGDWDQDYGIGGDLNMLIKYFDLTQQKIAERTESRRVAQLKNFPARRSPPMVYMTGQKNISMSNSEVKILREYLRDKHGMLFCDNGGSSHFHNQFLALMNRVLPEIRPVPVPLDDQIHRVPFAIPYLPYVAPHGGHQALGWYLDGRWLCYYHPGDIGDAWADGHAGVSPEIYEACYQLGANVIFYAHSEYSKWLTSQNQEK